MNAAMANVPAVIAVPTDVAGVSRSVVMPAIDTVRAFTANDAWIWRQHHHVQRRIHDVVAAGVTSPSVVVAPLAPVEPVADVMPAPIAARRCRHRTVSLYCGAPLAGNRPRSPIFGIAPEAWNPPLA
jgi:hypothetical protein